MEKNGKHSARLAACPGIIRGNGWCAEHGFLCRHEKIVSESIFPAFAIAPGGQIP